MPIKSPFINIVSEELMTERCAAGCPHCEYGRCVKGRRHVGKHRCESCRNTFTASKRPVSRQKPVELKEEAS
jgi:hypothetical protein